MNIEELNQLHKEKYTIIRSRIVLFQILALILIIPSLWIFPHYIQIRHAIGITIINSLIYGFAYLKEKEII